MRQRDWETEKAIHILELVRSELYMDMPHFLTALNTLMFKEDERVSVCATNGVYFYYLLIYNRVVDKMKVVYPFYESVIIQKPKKVNV